MSSVNEKGEVEYDYYLSLANFYDEGSPSSNHAPDETDLSLPSRTHGIPEKSDTTPEECVQKNAPFVV